MDGFSKLSREAQVVLVLGVLLLILSFLDWQQVSFGFGNVGGSVGVNEWHGIGVFAALLVIAMLVWEVVRLMEVNVSAGALSPGLVSVGLALLTAVLTVIAFLTKNEFRHWPAWAALLVALGVAAAAVMRARAEGVEMPQGKPAESAGSPQDAEPVGPAEPAGAAGTTDRTESPSE